MAKTRPTKTTPVATQSAEPGDTSYDPLEGHHDLSGYTLERLQQLCRQAFHNGENQLLKHVKGEIARREGAAAKRAAPADGVQPEAQPKVVNEDDEPVADLPISGIGVAKPYYSDFLAGTSPWNHPDYPPPAPQRQLIDWTDEQVEAAAQQRGGRVTLQNLRAQEEWDWRKYAGAGDWARRREQRARERHEARRAMIAAYTRFITTFGQDFAQGDTRRHDALMRFLKEGEWADVVTFWNPPFRRAGQEVLFLEGGRWRPGRPESAATLHAWLAPLTADPPILAANLPEEIDTDWWQRTLADLASETITIEDLVDSAALRDYDLVTATWFDEGGRAGGEDYWDRAAKRISAWIKPGGAERCLDDLLPALPRASLGEEDTPLHLYTPEGMFNLVTRDYVPPPDGKLPRRITAVAPDLDPNSPARRFWLESLAAIQPDPVMREHIQVMFAYALLGRPIRKLAFILKGDGWCGKTSVIKPLRRLLGDYSRKLDVNDLLRARAAGRDYSDLRGLRLVTASEFSRHHRFDTATWKDMVGADDLPDHRLGGSFQPQFVMVMDTNNLPTFSEDSEAVRRRMEVIPFDHVFKAGVDLDEGRMNALCDEKVLAAIFGWALEKVPDALAGRWQVPEAVRRATDAAMLLDDPYLSWQKQLVKCSTPAPLADHVADLRALGDAAGKPTPGPNTVSTYLKDHFGRAPDGPNHQVRYYAVRRKDG